MTSPPPARCSRRHLADDAAPRARHILDECHSIIEGDHFVYVNGDHGAGWIDKDVIFPDTRHPDVLGKLLADAVRDAGADIVCGPATGGLIVSQWTAHHLRIPAVFSEHDPAWTRPPDAPPGTEMRGPFILRRGYDATVRGKRVLVVDDIVNTGHSVRQTAGAIRAAGGNPVATACFVTRGNAGGDDVGASPFLYLLEELIPSWPAADCSLCRDHVPVNTTYAHGKEWVAAHGQP